MMYYIAKPTMETLKSHFESHYKDFIDAIAEKAGVTLEGMNTIDIGADYEKKGIPKPYLLIDLAQLVPDYAAAGMVKGTLHIDVLIAVEGYTDTAASEKASLYADAITAMIFADDTLNSNVQHIAVNQIDFYPGGTGNLKYVLVSLLLDVETAI